MEENVQFEVLVGHAYSSIWRDCLVRCPQIHAIHLLWNSDTTISTSEPMHFEKSSNRSELTHFPIFYYDSISPIGDPAMHSTVVKMMNGETVALSPVDTADPKRGILDRLVDDVTKAGLPIVWNEIVKVSRVKPKDSKEFREILKKVLERSGIKYR
ncbi:unnamed protein product [Calicophoron daubneyi]|uniref:Uncharacterized protein n=1 Tax=Calicophoron daubneyi TaxID=300641 RepID=A0AAV2T2E9_CALDB